MRNMILATLATVGLGLATAPPAQAQGMYASGYGSNYGYYYPMSPADFYVIPPGGSGTRVYGPGYTYTYPYMYHNNNSSYAQQYTYTYYYTPGMTPYSYYRGYNWGR
ncbi:MAG TPA: hypothetical protein VH120_16395 [Gemmataceae bacterium]|nr:hypothetical protein [Gemmataceae bacterium]